MNQDLMQDVYETLQGVREIPVTGVENAFCEGSVCEQSYNEMLAAYERLLRRLGENNEDADVEIIINSLRTITNELCARMYRYGALFGEWE